MLDFGLRTLLDEMSYANRITFKNLQISGGNVDVNTPDETEPIESDSFVNDIFKIYFASAK